ncbi:PREDICTED: protein SIEVE ELEMENT OCCLUSION B-like [Nicotiana attenuata]|uniref:Protein sieve element occlusion b n=1 Tax=Nicotiana attenuata TaxID=49451 RepID=A0A1J6IQ05_NICAT|nr:PREDICTED: protein SIEVE ELEMENT OCCLUSION B-like [Nicotiana attenuata]OIT06340.1 protein sieve element occlusion b [Nicotiana attenuata]
MASSHSLAARPQPVSRRERPVFSMSDDHAMSKKILNTHSPNGREVDVDIILQVIEGIFQHIHGALQDSTDRESMETSKLEENASFAFDGFHLEGLAYIMHKVSCQLTCKFSGGGDAHATTMEILGMLSSYQWDTKLVLTLASFSIIYGEFWLVTQKFATHPLAKMVALLKQLPDIIEHAAALKSRFDAINNLLKAILDITKCIIEIKRLPSQYISEDQPPMSVAIAYFPTAVYWTIKSIVACASQVTSLLGMSYEFISATTTDTWEMSSSTHKLNNISDHLRAELERCYEHIQEKKHTEYYQMLVHSFETTQFDNMKINKALIYIKDDLLPLEVGTTHTRANIDVLRRKTVLLLISDVDITPEEVLILATVYNESRGRSELQYEIVWLPISDRSREWNEGYEHKFKELQALMPWYTLHHPSLLEPAVIKFVKERWHFSKKMMLVALDPQQGKVVCQNAIHMAWIWGNLAYPFTMAKQEELWSIESWRLELVVDGIDQSIIEWMTAGKYICLYGGEDVEWIEKFTTSAKGVAHRAGIDLHMIYVGKSSNKDRVRRINSIIRKENLSYCLDDVMSVWYFWKRLESMFYSKMQLGKTIKDDKIMQEVLTMLSFDGSDQGWALISRGSFEMARAKSVVITKTLDDFHVWEEDAREKGFVLALIDYCLHLHTPQHCNRLILPGLDVDIPEMITCAECGRPMDKFFMYRCCTD